MTFTSDILQQTRFQYVVVALPILVTLVAGVTLGVVLQKLGVPEMARNLIGVGTFVGSIVIAVVYIAGGQGHVILTESELTVKPRWRSAKTIMRPPLEARLEPWIVRTSAVTALSGPMLVVRGAQGEVVLAAKDPEAAQRFPSKDNFSWLRAPHFVIAPEALSEIARRLRVDWPESP